MIEILNKFSVEAFQIWKHFKLLRETGVVFWGFPNLFAAIKSFGCDSSKLLTIS